MSTPSFQEKLISQLPAVALLQNLGYEYLTPGEASQARGDRLGGVVLDKVLTDQLRQMNAVRFRGREFPFSEGNILAAVQALKDVVEDGLLPTNEKVYDLLCMGKSLPQSIDGDTRSFQLRYIDWERPGNNVFHVTEEFIVERSGSHETRRPDIVLFVNGIPLVVIECKRPDMKDPIGQAISQHIRNQQQDEIPRLFYYAQLLLAVSKNEAKYATVGTPPKFWSAWKEDLGKDEAADLEERVNIRLSERQLDRILAAGGSWARQREGYGSLERQVTPQDRALYSLCRKDRLLELVFRFTLFDGGEKKIARHQQYFCVNKILHRVQKPGPDGTRQGGVVWHTQGSGKSLTMVMLAEALALERGLGDFKIILVTDRVDLDDQIYRTFHHCGVQPVQARTGRHLAELLGDNKARIITTVIDKFELAVGKAGMRNEHPEIFVLVDESHRGQFGQLHAKMKQALPKACFIGFTGTPVMKRDRSTIERFGGLIDAYTLQQAVRDKAVVPLLYEGRHVDQTVDSETLDAWFERVTDRLSDEQKRDLKRKFASSDQLNRAEQKVMRIAWGREPALRRQLEPYLLQGPTRRPGQGHGPALQALPRRVRRRHQRGAHLGAGRARGRDRRSRRVHRRGQGLLEEDDGEVRQREGVQPPAHQRLQAGRGAGDHHRRGQAAHRLRRPAQHRALPDAEASEPLPAPGHRARQPPLRRQGLRLHHRLSGRPAEPR